MGRFRISLFILAEVLLCSSSFAARKDFKGLFGNYRREKFTENEANPTDVGFDLMLSTLFPVSSIVESTESATAATTAMPSSNFFNVEGNVFLSLDYNWELYGSVGSFSFDTRRENTAYGSYQQPLFHQFEMSAIPVTLGMKYRFSEEDIVPYIGLGVGMSWVTRKGGYDYDRNAVDQENINAIVGQLVGGVEFFFTSRAGIRLEVGAYHFRLPSRTFNYSQGVGVSGHPIMVYQANPWLVRYASGIFILL